MTVLNGGPRVSAKVGGVASRPAAGAAAETPPARHPGAWSTMLRGVTVTLLLIFDQFPRLIGRSLLLTAAVLAVLVLLNDVLRPSSRARVVVAWVAVVFGVLALPGFLREPETEYGQQKVFLLVTLTLLATAAVAIVRNQRDVEALALALVAGSAVLAVAALVGDAQDGRAAGFGSNPIWLGRAIGVAVVAVVWLYFRRRLSMAWACGLAVLLVSGLVATGSRGPLVATVVALFALVLAGLRRKARRGRREWIGAGVMGALVVVVLALPSLLPPRMYALVVDPSTELAGSARSEMRERTVAIIAEHPAGIGYGNWTMHSWMIDHNYPHNVWLELLAEAGWLVGGAFILVFLAMAVRLWAAARTDAVAGFVLALLAFNAIAVSTSGDVNASRGLFVSLALGLLVLLRATADTDAGRHRRTAPSGPDAVAGGRAGRRAWGSGAPPTGTGLPPNRGPGTDRRAGGVNARW